MEIGSKTAEKNSAQTNKQTDKPTDTTNYNGHLAVIQKKTNIMVHVPVGPTDSF